MTYIGATDETGGKHEVRSDKKGRIETAPRELQVLDYATLTVSSTSVGFESASPAMGADNVIKRGIVRGIEMTCEDATVRYRMDGTAPTSTEGHEIFDEDYVDWINGYSLSFPNTHFIRTGATDAKLKITYWGEHK